MKAGRWLFPFALVFMLVAGLAVVNRPADAQSSGCSAVGGVLSSSPGVPYDNSDFREFTGSFSAGEAISASATGFDNPGIPYPVTLEVNGIAQNPFTIPADGTYTVRASVNSLPEQTNVTVSCSASGGGGGSSGGNPSWSGFADGRLNPDPAEYYSLWCSGNALNVYSAVTGRGVLLAAIPLAQVQALSVGGKLAVTDSAGGKISLLRLDQDAFRLEGNNGNSAPNEGSKSFSLSQCLARNGGPVAMATQTPVPRPPNTAMPSLTQSPTATASATTAPTNTQTPRPTRTPTATRTATPTKESAFTPSATQTASPTKAPTHTPTATRTLGPSPTPTATVLLRTVMPTPTRTPPRAVPSITPTITPTRGVTPFVLGLANLLTSPNDSDGDGTPNGFDFCKYVPGPANGCPDDDGDGVGNPLDRCPNSAGTPATFGCADADGDGVHDGMDLCPNFVPPADQNAQGCLDSDRDGIANIQDWCPQQVKVAGVSQFQGCNDPDGDGYVNGVGVPPAYRDNCPAVNGVNYDNGCPPPTPVPVGGVTVTPTLSLFDFANQQGSFDGLVVGVPPTATPSCGKNTYGFCLGN